MSKSHRYQRLKKKAADRARQIDSNSSPEADKVSEEGIRINKFIARAGVSSRRKADALIKEGKVKINGRVVTEFWTQVTPEDEVEVNGTRITRSEKVYILLNKPRHTITTTNDEKGRDTVMDLVDIPEAEIAGVFPVGRLDRDTQGVLLLTNDGNLGHRLMHPSYEIEKLYIVRTKEAIKPHQLEQLQQGVRLEDGLAKADMAIYTQSNSQHELGIKLHEGRNRQIRRMLEAIGHEVTYLERVEYAGLTSKGVRRGKWRRLESHEVKRLRRLVKLR